MKDMFLAGVKLRRYASKRSGYGQGLVDKATVESGRTTDLGKLKVAEGE